MDSAEIVIFHKKYIINGFTIKRGFIGAFIARRLVAVSSGWSQSDAGETSAVFVYRRKEKRWEGDWVDVYERPGVMQMIAAEVARRDREDWENYRRYIYE